MIGGEQGDYGHEHSFRDYSSHRVKSDIIARVNYISFFYRYDSNVWSKYYLPFPLFRSLYQLPWVGWIGSLLHLASWYVV
jgi:hypothetical protein